MVSILPQIIGTLDTNRIFSSLLGKQARNVNVDDEPSRKNDVPPAPAANQEKMNISDPVLHQPLPHKEPLEAYSEAPGDTQNRAAQAHNAAAHHVEPAQDVNAKAGGTSKKRVDDASLAKLVAEENASRSKFPRYPGLERWELIEKMGDGAFSNVYRARDLQGDAGEVAIKVVRKYEMNSMQVSAFATKSVYTSLFSSSLFFWFLSWPVLSSPFELSCHSPSTAFRCASLSTIYIDRLPTFGVRAPDREIGIYIRNSKRLRKQQRCEHISLLSDCSCQFTCCFEQHLFTPLAALATSTVQEKQWEC